MCQSIGGICVLERRVTTTSVLAIRFGYRRPSKHDSSSVVALREFSPIPFIHT